MRVILAVAMMSASMSMAQPAAASCPAPLLATEPKDGDELSKVLREQYVKYEYRIPMRDGVKLYTVAWVPRQRTRTWPIMLVRTPYSVNYGVDTQPELKSQRQVARFAPSLLFVREGYIFVHQDVRGRMMSEGDFVDVRPKATSKTGIDEATDAWDTIDFLVKHVPANNGKVGVWGISYPGFYAAQAGIDAHPALKAISPQAPVTNWFLGDDFHHNGALFLLDTFSFFSGFGKPRPQPTRKSSWGFDYDEGDAYDFFLKLGPLSNVNAKYFKNDIAFWNDVLAHPSLDEFWKARDPRPNYRAVKPAVLTVGGLFDAEDLWGAVATYHAFDSQSPGADVRLVLGPWRHGGWARTDGDKHHDTSFSFKTSRFYQEHIELPFFQKYLKGCAESEPAEAWVFETGTNLFQKFDVWPPKDAKPVKLFLSPSGGFSTVAPPADAIERWVSDPKKPVPYRSETLLENDGNFMSDDQRFAARRPDVVVHASGPLVEDLTVSGPVDVNLEVSTTGTDADFIVKLVDVSPFDRPDPEPNPTEVRLAGYQQLVRAEVFRGRFRTSFEKPTPFVPGQSTTVHFTLPDVNHTFRSGHKLMVQVQSSWFPLVDLNPQTFVDPAKATATDFVAATHQLFLSKTTVTLPVRSGALPQ